MGNPLHVTRVEARLKGRNVRADLGPKTLIYGPNEAGKDTVIQAVTLAVAGVAPDAEWSGSVTKGSDVIRLALDGEPVQTTAQLSDGRACAYKVERKGGGRTRSPAVDLPEGLVVTAPLDDLHKELGGNVKTRRAMVARIGGRDLTDALVKSLVPEHLQRYYQEGIETVRRAAAPDRIPASAALTAVQKWAESAVRAEEKTLAGMETIVAAVAANASKPTPEQIQAADTEVTRARLALQEAMARPADPDLQQLYAEAVQAHQAYTTAHNAHEANVTKLAELTTDGVPTSALDEPRRALRALLTLTVQDHPQGGVTDCVVCGHQMQVDPVQLQQNIAILDAALAKSEAVKKAQAAVSFTKPSVEQGKARYEQLAAEYQQAHAAQSAPGFVPKATAVSSAMTASDEAQAALLGLQAAVTAHDKHAEVLQQIEPLRARLEGLRKLAEACHAASEKQLKRVADAFRERVNSFLPSGDNFDCVLTAHGKPTALLGFREDGQLKTALSGAQRTRLLLALAAAEAPEGDDHLALFYPPERALDSKRLAATMRGLTNASGQVLLTSPVKPSGRTPKGWTVLKVEDCFVSDEQLEAEDAAATEAAEAAEAAPAQPAGLAPSLFPAAPAGDA